MPQRAGSADLPLHGGRVPPWLGQRLARLGAVMTQAIVHHYGRDEFLRRLAHPFWFQSFGAVMGMDWHSSGITTSVIGALKHGLKPLAGELGIHVCGGRGKHSRRTPGELVAAGDRIGFDGAGLARASRLVAKVDSAAVQDGFDLYLHGFIVTDDGRWTVVQQGMNDVPCRTPHCAHIAMIGAEMRTELASDFDRRRKSGPKPIWYTTLQTALKMTSSRFRPRIPVRKPWFRSGRGCHGALREGTILRYSAILS